MSINVADANIENLVKSTGLDEFQLAELINAKADEGWTNEEITDFLINEMTTENQAAKDEVYAMLGTHEPTWKDYYKLETKKKDPSLLQRLGMWLGENKAADEQRNANARAAIADSWNNWRDNTDPQYRVSLVNAMFGDTAPLHAYYQQQNAANEAAKNREFQAEQARLNRESQQEYNLMFKQLEEANQRKEQMTVDRKRALEILNKGEGATAIEKLELEQILSKYDDDALGVEDLRSRASRQSATDLEYAKFKSKMPRGEASQEDWNNWLAKGEEQFANDPIKLLEIQNAFNSRGQTAEEERREYGKGQARKAGEEAAADAREKAKNDKKIKEELAKGRNADASFLEGEGYNWDKKLQKWIK